MDQQTVARAATEALAGLSVPVFLAGFDGDETPRLTLHVARPSDRQSLQREAAAAMARAGVAVECRVRPLDHRCLDLACTLQDVMRSFAHGEIVYDPTESISRTKALLDLSQRLRSALGYGLRGVYLEPDSRTLYLACRPKEFLEGGAVDDAKQQRVEADAKAAVSGWRAEAPASFDLSVRLCFELPAMPLLPIDAASLDKSFRRLPWMARLHSQLIVGGIATLLGAGAAGSASADDLPAVSQVNGKLSAEGGEGAGRPLGEAIGSITAPVGHSFGVQLDGGIGTTGGQTVWGLAGQGFWRDPNFGLLGGFLTHMHADLSSPGITGTQLNRFGAEGQLYLGPFTPQLDVGWQTGGMKNGAFGVGELAWYPNDNLMLRAGADINPGKSLALADVEYLPGLAGLPGLSIFAEGAVSGSRANYALIGFRFYFGPDKTLIRRHREDDPPAMVLNQILGPSFSNRQTSAVCAR